jgi:xylulokinase
VVVDLCKDGSAPEPRSRERVRSSSLRGGVRQRPPDRLLCHPAARTLKDGKGPGMFVGLKHVHDAAAMMRAVMEGVVLENRQILEVFAALGVSCTDIRLTGGYSTLATWAQMQADIYGKRLSTLENRQATLLGAAILAGYGIRAFTSLQEGVRHMVRLKDAFAPVPEGVAEYKRVYQKYGSLIAQVKKHKLFRLAAD